MGTKVQLAVVCVQISSRTFSGFIVKLQVLKDESQSIQVALL